MEIQVKTDLYRFMVEGAGDIMFLLDEQGRFVFLNDRVTSLLGYNKQELVGKHYSTLLHVDDLNRSETVYANCINNAIQAKARNLHLRIRHKRGENNFRYFDIKLSPVPEAIGRTCHDPDNGGRAVMYGIARDITQVKSLKNIIHYNTNYDYLTGLPNRVLLKDRMKLAIAHARRESVQFAVMFLDLDGFKQVNDAFGHSIGDVLLQKVATRLSACLREEDTLARIGGDEFVLLLPGIRVKQEVGVIAAKLLKQFRNPFDFNSNSMELSASIGIALFPEDADTVDKLIEAADNAMYYVKQSDKNGYAFLADLPDYNLRMQNSYSFS